MFVLRVFSLFLLVLFAAHSLYAKSPLAGLPKNYPESRVEVDGRVFPWNTIGRINLSGTGHCTGALVGRKTVVTAAHCLWNKKTNRWWPPKYVHFVPGYRRDTYPAHSRAKDIYVTPNFPTPPMAADAALIYDWAFIELEVPLGDKLGFIDLLSFDQYTWEKTNLEKTSFQIAGYRGDRPHVLAVDNDCSINDFVSNGRLIEHKCATFFGDSGGPLLMKKDGKYQLVGVASAMRGEVSDPRGIVVPSVRFAKALELYRK